MGDLFSLGDAAEHLARCGFCVFPVKPLEKRPLVHRWDQVSTTRIDKIRRWWHARPDANIGIHAGASDLVILDLDRGKPWDPRHGEQPPGVTTGADALVDLAQRTGNVGDGSWMFDAPCVVTPSGGEHRYYRAPSGVTIKPSAGVLAPWVDVRAGTSYVVGPWSNAPLRSYRPTTGWDILEHGDLDIDFRVTSAALRGLRVDPPVLPAWIVDLLTAASTTAVTVEPRTPFERISASLDAPTATGGYLSAALARAVENVSTAGEGTRNHTLTREAYSLAGLIPHIDEATVETQMRHAAEMCGLPSDEAHACIRAAIRRGKTSPRRVSVYA